MALRLHDYLIRISSKGISEWHSLRMVRKQGELFAQVSRLLRFPCLHELELIAEFSMTKYSIRGESMLLV